ncbi:MAG: hypothetical protein IRZ11_06555, partial [Clostridia bacterium]|nr:hypothetical protein [Clostridia bacterium]
MRVAAWLAEGAALAAVVALVRVVWNAAHPLDLFTDSWPFAQLLGATADGGPVLARGRLTLFYPLAYLPFLPAAAAWGGAAAVRYAVPVWASVAVLPAVRLFSGGPAPLLAALALVSLPDASLKALTGTPQAVAEPLLVLALGLGSAGRRPAFLAVALATLATHHLSSLEVLVVYWAAFVAPKAARSGARAAWRAEWPGVLLFALWPAVWLGSFCAAGRADLAALLTLAVALGGLPFALAATWAAPHLERLRGSLRARLLARRHGASILAAAASLAALLASAWATPPGLSGGALGPLLALAYAGLAGRLAPALVLADDPRPAALAFAAGALASIVLVLGLEPFFDPIRLGDLALAAGLLAAFGPPAATPLSGERRRRTGLGPRLRAAALALAVVALGAARIGASWDRLFDYTAADWQAARWLAAHGEPGTTVLADARLSALVTGVGGHDATFEGAAGFFLATDPEAALSALARSPAYAGAPLRYVLIDGRILAQGADVGWYRPPAPARPDLPARLDRVATRVFAKGDAVVWRLDPGRLPPPGSAPRPPSP